MNIKVEDAIERLARLGCTKEELAAFLNTSLRALHERFAANAEFQERWERGRLQGRISLRHLQWWHAQRPNASGVQMAIHLSKQPHWLNETERPVHAFEGEDTGGEGGSGSPDAVRVLTDEELDGLLVIREKFAIASKSGGGEGSSGG